MHGRLTHMDVQIAALFQDTTVVNMPVVATAPTTGVITPACVISIHVAASAFVAAPSILIATIVVVVSISGAT